MDNKTLLSTQSKSRPCVRYRFIDHSLPAWLLGADQADQLHDLRSGRSARSGVARLEYVQQQQTQITAAPALPRFQQRLGSGEQDRYGGIVVFGFDVSLGHDPELLVSFVVGAFFDAGDVRVSSGWARTDLEGSAEREYRFSRRAFVFSTVFDAMERYLGDCGSLSVW